ncbi:MAG: MBL fold metallo-hydrolase [Bacteroidales bacterium]
MKKTILFSAILCFAFSVISPSQQKEPWFSVKELGKGVWVIGDHGADNIYIIEGSDSALLVDTGLGVADLVSVVRKITTKPLIVVNTHGHPDHSGANYQFEKIFMHASDIEAAKQFNLPESRGRSAGAMTQGNTPADEEKYKDKPYDTKYIPVKEGYVFRLGGRRIQVMETPGHTPGSICFLDIENKLLFSGDNNNILVWLFLQNCTSLHRYLETLQKQQERMAEFTTLMPGHGTPIPSDFINDQVACVKSILDGTCQAKEYKSFAGNAMICSFGRASVAYRPDNL